MVASTSPRSQADAPAILTWVAIPALSWLAAATGGASLDGLGAWHAGLASLVLVTAHALFARPASELPARIVLGAGLVVTGALPAMVVGESVLIGIALVLLVWITVRGLRRCCGAPHARPNAFAIGIAFASLFLLHLADPVARLAGEAEGYRLRQELFAWDLPTAYAYDALAHDRLHEPAVYEEVPLASSVIRLPTFASVSVRFGVLAALLWGLACFRERRRCAS